MFHVLHIDVNKKILTCFFIFTRSKLWIDLLSYDAHIGGIMSIHLLDLLWLIFTFTGLATEIGLVVFYFYESTRIKTFKYIFKIW